MKAKITIKNIKGFLQGNTRKIFDEWFNMSESHIKEQAVWRLLQVKKNSPECFESDECKICHCTVSGKVFEDRMCSLGEREDLIEQGLVPCYPPMMTKEEWEQFKQSDEYLNSIK